MVGLPKHFMKWVTPSHKIYFYAIWFWEGLLYYWFKFLDID